VKQTEHTMSLTCLKLPPTELERMRRVAEQVGMSFEAYVTALAEIAGKSKDDFLQAACGGIRGIAWATFGN